MLDSEQVEQITVDFLNKREPRVRGAEADEFRRKLKVEIATAEENGWQIDIPHELPIEADDDEPTHRMAVAHAPKGGVTINGKFFVGGEFIPGVTQSEVDRAAQGKQNGPLLRQPATKNP